MDWPKDADGDVMRRLARSDFDFTKSHPIDFNVEFQQWPPAQEALALLKEKYDNVSLCEPEDGDRGVVVAKLFDKVSYGLVIRMQAELTEQMIPFGGICESWGVLH